MPFEKFKIATSRLTDSLYYNLSVSNGNGLTSGLAETRYSEPYYHKDKKIISRKYTLNSYRLLELDKTVSDTAVSVLNCGIDPAIIQVIKSEKYQNTLIATREFEARLKLIFKTCNNSVLEVYINNLEKNLYELDSMAAIKVGECQYRQD